MAKELTNSKVDRQNILNNQFALEEIRKEVGLEGIIFEGEYRFLKDQISTFFEVDSRTIDRYLEKHWVSGNLGGKSYVMEFCY